MGEVWLARDEGPEGFQKTVVVKRLLPEAGRYLEYFKAEARLVAQLPHQNIVQVINFFVDEDHQHNIVMEYVEGCDLEELIFTPRGRLTPEMSVYIAAECLRGLDFAHSARIDRTRTDLVHRDISPHNILVSYGGEVKVTDFGIAKAELEYRQKTEGNKFRGKLSYASPEALDAEAHHAPLDRRADVYAMGVVLREMLTKERTFSGSMWQTLVAVKEGKVRPLRELRPDLPQQLVEIVDKMMHVDREQRFGTAGAARAALVRALPDWAVADGPLRDFVRTAARRQLRLTSPFLGGDGGGRPMHVREEGTPIPVPVLKATPESPTHVLDPISDRVTQMGHRAAETALAPTMPAGLHRDPTMLRDGATGVLELRNVTTEPSGPTRRTATQLRTWALFLFGLGAAFAVSATIVYVVKRNDRVVVATMASGAPAAASPTRPEDSAAPIPIPARSPSPSPSGESLAPPVVAKQRTHVAKRRATEAGDDIGFIVMQRANADVSVDGVYAGHTPLRHMIASGAHRVTLFDTKTFKRTSLDVHVSAGRSTMVGFQGE